MKVPRASALFFLVVVVCTGCGTTDTRQFPAAEDGPLILRMDRDTLRHLNARALSPGVFDREVVSKPETKALGAILRAALGDAEVGYVVPDDVTELRVSLPREPVSLRRLLMELGDQAEVLYYVLGGAVVLHPIRLVE